MKGFLVSLLEGVIVGIIMVVIMLIFDIEATVNQTVMLICAAIVSTSAATSIGGMIKKGKDTVFYEWVYKYGETRIEVTLGFVERLYINDELVYENKKVKLNRVELKGRLKTDEEVRAIIIGGMTTKCELFVGDKLLQPVVIKTP